MKRERIFQIHFHQAGKVAKSCIFPFLFVKIISFTNNLSSGLHSAAFNAHISLKAHGVLHYAFL